MDYGEVPVPAPKDPLEDCTGYFQFGWCCQAGKAGTCQFMLGCGQETRLGPVGDVGENDEASVVSLC
jgi:hypothetical protein